VREPWEISGVLKFGHADLAVHGLGLGETIVDVLAERVQRHAALTLPLATRDVRTAETAGALNTNALGTERHGHFHSLLHGATERDAAFELEGDVLSDELSLDLGLLDLLDVEEDLLARELRELVLDLLDLLTLAADHHARTGGVDLDAHAVGGALDEDARHRGLLELLHQLLADDLVLEEELREILLGGEPAGLPVPANGKTETGGIGLLAHGKD
jgi:hypothetical protein